MPKKSNIKRPDRKLIYFTDMLSNQMRLDVLRNVASIKKCKQAWLGNGLPICSTTIIFDHIPKLLKTGIVKTKKLESSNRRIYSLDLDLFKETIREVEAFYKELMMLKKNAK